MYEKIVFFYIDYDYSQLRSIVISSSSTPYWQSWGSVEITPRDAGEVVFFQNVLE